MNNKIIEINEDIKIPGTNIILEAGDKIEVIKEASLDTIITLDKNDAEYKKLEAIAKKYKYRLSDFEASYNVNRGEMFIRYNLWEDGMGVRLPNISCFKNELSMNSGIPLGNMKPDEFENAVNLQYTGLKCLAELQKLSFMDALYAKERDLKKTL